MTEGSAPGEKAGARAGVGSDCASGNDNKHSKGRSGTGARPNVSLQGFALTCSANSHCRIAIDCGFYDLRSTDF